MNIEEARKARGMSRKDVSRKLGIPYRSLENWEKGLSKCPDYVETASCSRDSERRKKDD
jgi:DNA-binding transcriptional regulator YiaG